MTPWEQALLYAYYAVLSVLAVYGVHRSYLVWLYYRHRKADPTPKSRFTALPKVAVQLPIFNEATVAERLLEGAAALDYPLDRLVIQVLDDSTDETVEIVAAKVAELRARGVDIHHVRRGDRAGFKAGALAAGMRQTDAEFLAVFDADFVPPPHFLRSLIDYFTDPEIGMVQARWGHLNRRFSLFTRMQALLLDGHFVIEHTARNRSGRFFNFNGTAGMWRRAAILEAGGWQHDTLTEDLDLSYRAQLQGWRFVYLKDVICPAELPIEMNAFKSQQRRWAKGSIQTCRKLLGEAWRSGAPLGAKIEATFHLTNNLSYLLMMVMIGLLLPALLARLHFTTTWQALLFDSTLFMAATSSMLAFYAAAQKESQGQSASLFLRFPALLALGIGLAPSNSLAVLEALRGRQTAFERTPKYNVGDRKSRAKPAFRYQGLRSSLPIFEVLLGVYFTAITAFTLSHRLWLVSVFMSLFAAGFYWAGLGSLLPLRTAPPPAPSLAAAVPAPAVAAALPDAARQAIQSKTGAY